MLQFLELARKISLPTDESDPRNFFLGCVGERRDGAVVSGKNGAVYSTTMNNYQLVPNSHAEGRVLRKMGRGGILYVARAAKRPGYKFAMSKPCAMCQIRIKSQKIDEVYYSINDLCYGRWYPKKDTDDIFHI